MAEQAKPTVFEALNAVMQDVQAVKKGDKNTHQNFMFRGIDAVMNACGPALRKHGVIAVPIVEDMQRGTVQTRNSTMTTVQVQMRVRWYGPAGDYFDSITWGEAFDSGDKATAKAHSVAFRTAFLETLALPTDEPDPDHDTYVRESPEEQRVREAQERKAYVAEQTQHILRAETQGDVATLEKASRYYSNQGDREMAQIAGTTLERLQKAQMQQAAETVQETLDGQIVQEGAK